MSTQNTEIKTKSSFERNQKKLAALERDWAVLGILRPITFTVAFEDDDEADLFAASLPEKGFIVSHYYNTSDRLWSVNATLKMEPSAANVTHWEEWFEQQALLHDGDDGYRAFFEGWSYPRMSSPTFSLEGGNWDHNRSAQDRAEILFGQTLGRDPVSKGKYDGFGAGHDLAPPFCLVPSDFLRKAREQRPVSPEPTATKFAQWIYSLYGSAFGNPQDQERGTEAEEHILAARQEAYRSADNRLMREKFPEWQLVHNGMHNTRGNKPTFFTISDLSVAGQPLRVLPDLIYANRHNGEMIIVEIKHSHMTIPNNLWPNIWGQLWCYSQLEQVRRSPRVTVVGEIWGDAWTKGRGSMRLVCLRASVRRDPYALPYDRFFRSLFDIYRGVG